MYSCNKSKPILDDIPQEINMEELNKDTDLLMKLNYQEAVKKFGTPHTEGKYKIEKEGEGFEIDGIIQKHFPNKEYLKEPFFILEAAWKRQQESWVKIWYKEENDKWIPFEMLVTI